MDTYINSTGHFANVFTVVESLGEGSFGKVFKAIHKIDQEPYAVKKVKLQSKKVQEVENMLKEVNVMKAFNHSCIVRYITCWFEEDPEEDSESSINYDNESESEEEKEEAASKRTISEKQLSGSVEESSAENSSTPCEGFEFEKAVSSNNKETPVKQAPQSEKTHIGKNKEELGKALYIQMELCDQNLRDYLEKAKDTLTVEIINLFLNVLEGVQEMHKKGILHQDLKPANIFLGKDKKAKVGDFGLASLFKPSQNLSKEPGTKGPGTEAYMAPEHLEGRKGHSEAADVFSLGLIFYEMLGRFTTSFERYDLFKKLRHEHEISPRFKSEFAKESCLIQKMTIYYPNKRPNVTQIIGELKSIRGDYTNCGLNQIHLGKPEWKVEKAKVKEYARKDGSQDGPVESLLVETESGLLVIKQGISKHFAERPPALETEVKFKYLSSLDGKLNNPILTV